MPTFMSGLTLSNYRGIGPVAQRMGPFKRFNYFIGANNSGKSIILNFISKHLPLSGPYNEAQQKPLDPLEIFSGGTVGQPSFSIGIPKARFVQSAVANLQNASTRESPQYVQKIADRLADKGLIWLGASMPYRVIDHHGEITLDEYSNILTPREWSILWHELTGASQGSLTYNWFPESIKYIISRQNYTLPKTVLIPAKRGIGPAGQDFKDFSGVGMIDQLAQIQSPDHDKRADTEKFERINDFLRVITDRPDARIEIPHNRNHILVHIDNKVLPLASLGTGIHEVIVLAASCTLNDDCIVCIEEPEVHLHPILQRKLGRYLNDRTSNQYFIATHSSVFIDTPGAAIFHVNHDGDQTYVRESIMKADRYNICIDLGHRASDIVQSNAIIWVEGPSERIYIEFWITSVAPELVEGMHYSIMFYGGRLLSHLSADDNEVSAFIDLRQLNRNLIVVMDSDKTEQEGEINSTKQRIVKEIDAGPGIAWVTAGREIENYVEYNIIQGCLQQIHPDLYNRPDAGGPFDHAFAFRTAEPRPQAKGRSTTLYMNADKVKLARKVCEQPPNLDILDLRERITAVVEMIRAAND